MNAPLPPRPTTPPISSVLGRTAPTTPPTTSATTRPATSPGTRPATGSVARPLTSAAPARPATAVPARPATNPLGSLPRPATGARTTPVAPVAAGLRAPAGAAVPPVSRPGRDALPPADLAWVRELVFAQTAIVLGADKEYLVASRLLPFARTRGHGDVASYVAWMRRSGTASDHREVIEAMTTNETSWFRDGEPYTHLRKHLVPDFVRARSTSRTLRIWSAACSTGQEPYSIAMVLRDEPALTGWKIDLHATDVDVTVLDQARAGRFSQLEVNRGLPAPMLVGNFTRAGAHWQVNQNIRSLVTFSQANLARPFPPMGTLDIIFCRNVLIYFDTATKRQILARMKAVLAPDGYLVLGSAETTLGVSTEWEKDPRSRASIYRPIPGGTR